MRGPILVATSCHPCGGLYRASASQCGAGPGREVRVTHRHRMRYVTDLPAGRNKINKIITDEVRL